MDSLIIIAGPTATGKSALAVKLAEHIGGSVISCDSMQVYKGMDIGTAKITQQEMDGIDHYLIDVLDPSEDFNIVSFKQMAVDAIADIRSMGRIPIMCGGTGFYIQSVLYDIDFSETEEDDEYRKELAGIIRKDGSAYVHSMLRDIDPEAAAKIDPNDHKRMIRALEYHRQTGMKISDHNAQNRKRTAPYDFCYFVLTGERSRMYARIDERVDRMIEAGLVDEVRGLMAKGLTKDNVSMKGLGYKEIIDYLEGSCTLEDAVYRIKRDSRHFAKRQLTWFRRERDTCFIDIEKDDIMEIILKELKWKGIIDG